MVNVNHIKFFLLVDLRQKKNQIKYKIKSAIKKVILKNKRKEKKRGHGTF